MHTFGIGDGASTELVKNVAAAGRGHYSMIANPQDIEKKVLEALQKDYLEYLNIQGACYLDEDMQVVKQLDPTTLNLTHGERFMLTDVFVEGTKRVKYFKLAMVDPNTDQAF